MALAQRRPLAVAGDGTHLSRKFVDWSRERSSLWAGFTEARAGL